MICEKDKPIEDLTEAQAEWIITEIVRCSQGYKGFVYFCKNYVLIEDKVSGKAVPMELFRCQKEVARDLFNGDWMVILKARQLGMTWLMAAYVLWNMIFKQMWSGAVMNQDATYAMDFLNRLRFMHSRLPNWLRPEITTDQKEKIRFDGFEHGTECRSLAATEKSCRSVTGNFILCDEAAYIDLLLQVKSAAEPAIAAGGSVVIMSTSNGPKGAFHDIWQASPANRYKPVFFPWWERPGRTEEWYRAEKKASESNPLHVKREYPATPEEAWESAEGRVLKHYTDDIHKRTVQELGFEGMNKAWKYYRAVDWGGADPFVCLFIAVIPEKQGFSVDPSCKDLIREIKAYQWNAPDVPEDDNNHAIDALRYFFMTYSTKDGKLNGHVHVYKSIYVRHPDSKFDLDEFITLIKRESGKFEFDGTVADRARKDSINFFRNNGIPTRKYVTNSDKKSSILYGIELLNASMSGVNLLHVRHMPDPLKDRYKSLQQARGSLTMKDLFFMEQYRLEHPTEEAKLVHPILGTDY